jgi:hypothetical protein
MRMKANIPMAMLLRVLPYCSTFQYYFNVRPLPKIIPISIKAKTLRDRGSLISVHVTYFFTVKYFSRRFHSLWARSVGDSLISESELILGTLNKRNESGDQVMFNFILILQKREGNSFTCSSRFTKAISFLYS